MFIVYQNDKYSYTKQNIRRRLIFMEKKKNKEILRISTNQPGVYKNTKTGKYDVKYCYTEVNHFTTKKEYKAKWVYGINSYKVAVSTLAKMKGNKLRINTEEINLEQSLELWIEKAEANNFSNVSIRNTRQQFIMITKFWSPQLALSAISEENYLRLITQCREYGYSEETIWNINACLRKLINLAYKNRYLKENPIDFWDSPRIKVGVKRNVIPIEEFEKLSTYFKQNEFMRLGKNCYVYYHFLVELLYWTGMRIGEVLALQYDDFEECARAVDEPVSYMRVSVTKSYNSLYKLLKGTKNDKTRKIPLPQKVIDLYRDRLKECLLRGGNKTDSIFSFDHGACTTVIKRACKKVGIREYNCHDFRHTYISNLIKQATPIPVIESVSGDTQETIFKRYSHMFEADEYMVLKALEAIEFHK